MCTRGNGASISADISVTGSALKWENLCQFCRTLGSIQYRSMSRGISKGTEHENQVKEHVLKVHQWQSTCVVTQLKSKPRYL